MSVKSKLFATAAALTLVGGASVAGLATAGTAHAATAECGIACWDIFSGQYGTHHDPAFLVDSYKQGEATGTPIILFEASNTDPALDFTVGSPDLVSDYFQAGLVSSALALHYGCEAGVDFQNCLASGSLPGSTNTAGNGVDDYAFEIQYAPYGAPTGECVGVAATATSGEKVSLEPCGVSGKTLWIIDNDGTNWDFFTDDGLTAAHGYFPLINGSDTNFSQPFVLTYPGGAYPTDKPRPQLEVTNLDGYVVIASGVPTVEQVPTNQTWAADTGTYGLIIP
jgi:hypothetical protein